MNVPYDKEILTPYLMDIFSTIKESKLKEAIMYSVLVGGKRIRPFLIISVAEMFNTNTEDTLRLAAIFEIMHCATLIDDDYPTIDNSDTRRGKPTTHVVFGDAIALFAGSSMFSLALGELTKLNISSNKKLLLLEILSRTFGPNRCYYGQTLDVLATNKKEKLEVIDEIHTEKTGSLIEGAIECGLTCADNVPENTKEILLDISKELGLLFQIHNDILDFEGYDGRYQEDIQNNKLSTYVGMFGIEEAKQHRDTLYDRIITNLEDNVENSSYLQKIIKFITYRDY